jgi:pimeloyl-ACP methyl ester carboxylesterase
MNIRRYAASFFGVVVVLVAHAAFSAADDTGLVLLHGKGGAPSGYIGKLASALRSKGYLLATPTMPWARDRIYDAAFEDSLVEIDKEVAWLRQKGASPIVVGGHSLGATVALGYAASRVDIAGVLLIAPGHNPHLPEFATLVEADVSRARSLIAAGKGNEKRSFSDLNQGRVLRVTATPRIYLSWLDPNGSVVLPKLAASLKAPTPLLVVIGAADPAAHGKDYFFDKAPPHSKSKFVIVTADHFAVPTAAIDDIETWLSTLRAARTTRN